MGKKAAKKDVTESKTAEKESIAPKQESLQVRRYRANIRAAFNLFLGFDEDDRIIQEEVGSVIRYLGQFPTEKAIVDEILPTMQSEDPDAYVTFSKFESRMLEMLRSNEYPAEGQDIILSAFRALDEDKNGYLEVEYVTELLTQMGCPLRANEMEQFLSTARDSESGRIYYEDYAITYAKQIDANAARLVSTKVEETKS